MATVSVFPPAANIVWSDARGSYGIANAELIYWPARSGLHLSPTLGHAWQHLDYDTSPRFLECTAPLDSIVPIPGEAAKCKTPRVRVVREVDMAGHQVTGEGAAS